MYITYYIVMQLDTFVFLFYDSSRLEGITILRNVGSSYSTTRCEI